MTPVASTRRAPVELVDDNSRLSLSVSLDAGACWPGSTLHPVVRVKGEHSYEKISLRLVGESRATIMGLDRWQAGAIMNATMGTGGAGGLPVNSFERLTFLDVDVPLLSTPPTRASNEKKGALLSSCSSLGGGTYELMLPHPADDQLLPTLTRREADSAGTSIAWMLRLEGIRKGLFRRNDSLSIELPVVFPTTSSALALYPDETVAVQQVKDEANTGERLSLAYQPISTRSSPLHFTLALTPSSSHAQHLLTSSVSPLVVNASLARRTRTTPIAHPENGKEFDWAGVRIAGAQIRPDTKRVRECVMRWEGEVVPPVGEHTVKSHGIAIMYSLTCRITSPVLAQGALHLAIPVFLPSSPFDLPETGLEGGAGSSRGSDLPAYEA
ncbi:hypothetical protein JCM21900_004615 [Sporobolomyces salmonicolor]